MRRRDISPEFWRDERVFNLPSDAHRLLLPGLWQIADREGRLEDRPFNIGIECRPWDVQSVPALLEDLAEVGLIIRYEVDGQRIIALPPKAWKRYQRPHPNEVASKLPGIPEGFEDGAPRYSVRSTKVLRTRVRPFMPSGSSGSSGPSGSSDGAPAGDPRGAPKKRKAAPKPPAQASLGVVPPPPPPEPKKPTPVELTHALFLELRAQKLQQLGLPVTPDAAPNWARSAATVHAWSTRHPADDDETKQAFIECLIGEFLKDAFWAGARADKDNPDSPPQPYPWSALMSERVWRKLADRLDAEFGLPAVGGVH